MLNWVNPLLCARMSWKKRTVWTLWSRKPRWVIDPETVMRIGISHSKLKAEVWGICFRTSRRKYLLGESLPRGNDLRSRPSRQQVILTYSLHMVTRLVLNVLPGDLDHLGGKLIVLQSSRFLSGILRPPIAWRWQLFAYKTFQSRSPWIALRHQCPCISHWCPPNDFGLKRKRRPPLMWRSMKLL